MKLLVFTYAEIAEPSCHTSSVSLTRTEEVVVSVVVKALAAALHH